MKSSSVPISPTPPLLPLDFVIRSAEVIRTLSHPLRLRVLEYLDIHGESPVFMICEGLSEEQATVSQHLGKLRTAGILSARRCGKTVLYALAEPHALTILNCLRQKAAGQS